MACGLPVPVAEDPDALLLSSRALAYGQSAVVEVVEWLQVTRWTRVCARRTGRPWRWLRSHQPPRRRGQAAAAFYRSLRESASSAVVLANSPSYRGLRSQAAFIELAPAERSLLARWRDRGEGTDGFDVVGAPDVAHSREIAFRAVGLLRAALTAEEWSLVRGVVAPPQAAP